MDETKKAIKVLIERALHQEVTTVDLLPTGVNSQIYKIATDKAFYIAKHYIND